MNGRDPSTNTDATTQLPETAGTDDVPGTSPDGPSHQPASWAGASRAYAWLLLIAGAIALGAAVELALDKTISGQ
ncbi:hypothetical protein [Streptacidiphilus anmyonensis]|uniref:hypothetical protein n=1 Tax=Streptacidiphilus anmyonensis TaxID=405782 RepID=UPI00128B8121|nr:hypothetical protein [Streptacidiphilus anmyonensis]